MTQCLRARSFKTLAFMHCTSSTDVPILKKGSSFSPIPSSWHQRLQGHRVWAPAHQPSCGSRWPWPLLAHLGGAGSTSSSRLRTSNTPATFKLLAASKGNGERHETSRPSACATWVRAQTFMRLENAWTPFSLATLTARGPTSD